MRLHGSYHLFYVSDVKHKVCSDISKIFLLQRNITKVFNKYPFQLNVLCPWDGFYQEPGVPKGYKVSNQPGDANLVLINGLSISNGFYIVNLNIASSFVINDGFRVARNISVQVDEFTCISILEVLILIPITLPLNSAE